MSSREPHICSGSSRFWRYWVWHTVLPVLLLFIAVYTRIAAYGLTEPRYAVVLIGVLIEVA